MRRHDAAASARSRTAALVLLAVVALGACLLACSSAPLSAASMSAKTSAGRETLPPITSAAPYAFSARTAVSADVVAVVAHAGDDMCACCMGAARVTSPTPAPTPRACTGAVPHAPPVATSATRFALTGGIEPVPKTLSELSRLRI